MKSILTYALILTLVILTIGCSTENPLCSDNYCVSGEIFLRSQLFEDEEFSEVNVNESQLLASFANATSQTPVDTVEADTATKLSQIPLETLLNQPSAYHEQIVHTTAYVVNKSQEKSAALSFVNADDFAAKLSGKTKAEKDEIIFAEVLVITDLRDPPTRQGLIDFYGFTEDQLKVNRYASLLERGNRYKFVLALIDLNFHKNDGSPPKLFGFILEPPILAND